MAIAHAHTTGRVHSSASSDGFLLWLSEECWGRGLTRLAELLVAHPSPQELICSPSGRPSSLSHVDPELEGLLQRAAVSTIAKGDVGALDPQGRVKCGVG